jgi:protein-arginine kinase
MADIKLKLQQRKTQFEEFLAKICPENKKELLDMVKNKSIDEFIFLFKFFVIPMEDRLDDAVTMLMEKHNITNKDISKDDIGRLKAYIKIFCEFIKLIN